MTAATVVRAGSAAEGMCEFPRVLRETVFVGPAARLAAMLDPAFLVEAGWNPTIRVLSLPAQHPLLGRTLCRVDGCTATAHGTKIGGLCWRCFARLTRV
ncbi:MAG: transposase, partial [Actinomycetes bacterium]